MLRAIGLPRNVPVVLAQSAVRATHTGNTDETTLATIPIPAGAMGANGRLLLDVMFSGTSSGNSKTYRARLGGTEFFGTVQTTYSTVRGSRAICNRNSQSSQVSFVITNAAGFAAVNGAIVTGAVDTSVAQNLTLTVQLASAGETASLEAYTVYLERP